MASLNILEIGAGDSTPVFLIHGFTGDAQRWVLIQEPIGAVHPIFAVEMTNHGDSPRRSLSSFEDLVADVIASFDCCGFEKAHFVGHSLGGAVATALADARADRCASLSLLAPAGLGPQANGPALKRLATAARAEELRSALQMLVFDAALITDEFIEIAVEVRSDASLRAAQAEMGQMLFPNGRVPFDLHSVLAQLNLPIQIIWGTEDRILPWQDVLQVPGDVALHLFDEMGHIPQLEHPERVTELLLRHFRAAA